MAAVMRRGRRGVAALRDIAHLQLSHSPSMQDVAPWRDAQNPEQALEAVNWAVDQIPLTGPVVGSFMRSMNWATHPKHAFSWAWEALDKSLCCLTCCCICLLMLVLAWCWRHCVLWVCRSMSFAAINEIVEGWLPRETGLVRSRTAEEKEPNVVGPGASLQEHEP
eukprot:1149497-Pelagomonas_calceolata.AAC.9